eukprot:14386333-Alexandrium_andersonii.AAC.1
MSASLVGSEMCIRDRGTAAASPSGSRPASEEPEGRSEPAFVGVGSAGAEAGAVDTSEQMSDIGEPE